MENLFPSSLILEPLIICKPNYHNQNNSFKLCHVFYAVLVLGLYRLPSFTRISLAVLESLPLNVTKINAWFDNFTLTV